MCEPLRVAIAGLGGYVPEKKLTNADLEKMVDTSDEWITTRTGIKERRIARDNEPVSEMSTNAARVALQQAGLKPEDLQLITLGTVSGDVRFPATACLIQNNIGAVNAAAYDVAAGCTAFIYGLFQAKALIASEQVQNALVIGAEKLSALTDWTDRSTCVIFGDGAGAAILTPLSKEHPHELLSVKIGSDGSQWRRLYSSTGLKKLTVYEDLPRSDWEQQLIYMEGNEIFKYAVRSLSQITLDALDACGLSIKDVAWMVPHQANNRILTSVAKKLDFPEEKVYTNLEKYGNISAGSIPVALTEAQNLFKPGDIIVCAAFGAGVTWGACVIRW